MDNRITYVCIKGAVNVAINNKRLDVLGLVFMLDYCVEGQNLMSS